jgi:two-component system, cell cycle sensor histidine kinase and response regulator CckA
MGLKFMVESFSKVSGISLFQDEEMFNFALSAAGVAVWEYNVSTGRVKWSSQVELVLGFAPSSFGDTLGSLIAVVVPEDRAKLLEAVQKSLLPGNNYQVQYRIIRPNGQIRWVEGKGRAYFDEMGQPLRLSGIVQDITDHKQTELALVESEARFMAFMEISPAAAFILDDAANIFYANKAYYQTFEIEGNIIGRNCSDLFPADVNAKHRQHDQEVLKQQKIVIENESWQRADGSMGHWVGYKFPITEANGRRLVGGIGVDVTSNKQAQEALRLSEARLAAIIDSATDAIITLNSQHQIVIFNSAAEKMFGYSADEVKGSTVDRFIPPRYRSSHFRHIIRFGETATTKRNMVGSLSAVRSNGEEFPIEATISSVQAAEQQLFSIIIRDVTERKKAEEALAKSEAQLRQSQKMEAVGQLAGGIAHDFNNLLTAITGYSDLILLSLNENDPLYEDVTEIQQAANRAGALTGQLLAFSRQQVLQPVDLDLNDVVGDMYRMLQRLIGENIELRTLPSADLAKVRADRGQLEQVIVNLAVNARDAMPRGGKLIFETSNVELDEGYQLYHPEIKPGRYVRLAVSDTGCGMSEALSNRIFEPFFTTKERGRGTGLGLSTVYGIIKQSGGYIKVYSEEGVGTTFKIYLPMLSSHENQFSKTGGSTGELSSLKTTRQETVLLVEDDEAVRNLTIRVLKQYNYNVLSAGNGEEALAICRQYPGSIDVLLTDVMLPKLSGPVLAKRLLALQPSMKVIYISGYTDGLLMENEQILSRNDVKHNLLQKPFTPQALAKKIWSVLEMKI